MPLETERFIVHEIEPKYAPRGGIRADRIARQQVVGYEALTVQCKECGDLNRVASHSPGLSSVAGGVIVECPSCGSQEPIAGRKLAATQESSQ